MKKILSFVLALLMTIGCASIAMATDEAEAITEDAALVATAPGPYDEAVAFLEANGILKGRDNYDLALESPIKRYEMAIFVSRLLTGWIDDSVWKEDYNKDYSAFDDLDGSGAVNYYGAIRYAEEKGVIQGYGDKKFGPEDGIIYKDALTMMCRALGYGGQSYPWGYIECAINLGLTAGIENVAWTQELVRGEVAQIIYNALFIPTAAGDTLASRIWGVDIAWQIVVITATPNATLDEVNTKTGAGKIAFQVVDTKTGKLTGKEYVVSIAKAMEDGRYAFDLDSDKAADIAIVTPYRTLLTSKDDYVQLVDWQKLPSETIWNEGCLKEYAIQAYLSNYTLKTAYGTDTYLHTVGEDLDIIVREGLPSDVTYTTKEVKLYAIDWTNGDILKIVGVKKDDTPDDKTYTLGSAATTTNVEIGKDTPYSGLIYEVEWIYNAANNLYFRYEVDTKTGKILGIETLKPSDIETLINAKFALETKTETKKLAILTKKPGKTAYASLELYDITQDGINDWGLYEEYGIGKVTTVDGDKLAVTQPYSVNKGMYKLITGEDFKAVESEKTNNITLVDDIQPGIAMPVKGDYVIYNFNKQTKELKIVKVINQINDEYNYIGRGVVRAYDVAKGKVVLSSAHTAYVAENTDTTLTFDYADLKWNALVQPSKKDSAAAYVLYDYFGDIYNQYVEYVVCDGKLVDIYPVNESGVKLIAVDAYAGISDDGTVVVLGYNAFTGKYGFYRIGSYDGWHTGDYFFYGTGAGSFFGAGFGPFRTGAPLLKVISYDKNTDTYYVEGYEWDVDDVDNKIYLAYEGPNVKHYAKGEDYMGKDESLYTLDDWTAHNVRMKSDDKYIIVNMNPEIDEPVVLLYEGKLKTYTDELGNTKGWFIDGWDLGNNVYLVWDSDDFEGFGKEKVNVEYVLFESWDNKAAAYDTWQKGTTVDTSWYLLGASTKLAICRNALNPNTIGEYMVVNDKLEPNTIYVARDGFIVGKSDLTLEELIAYVASLNKSFGYDVITGEGDDFVKDYLTTKDAAGRKLFSKKVISYNEDIAWKYRHTKDTLDPADIHEYSDLITGDAPTVWFVDGFKMTSVNADNYDKLTKGATAVPFYYIFKEGDVAYVYIFKSELVTEGEEDVDVALVDDNDVTVGTLTVTVKTTKNADGTAYEITAACFGDEAATVTDNGDETWTITGDDGSEATVWMCSIHGPAEVKISSGTTWKLVKALDTLTFTDGDETIADLDVTATFNSDGTVTDPKGKIVVYNKEVINGTTTEHEDETTDFSYDDTRVLDVAADPADVTFTANGANYDVKFDRTVAEKGKTPETKSYTKTVSIAADGVKEVVS